MSIPKIIMEKTVGQDESRDGRINNNNINKLVEEETNLVKALQIIQSGGLPMVLKAVSDLNVFNIMSKAGAGCQLSAKQIADQISTNNPDAPSMIDRMLRLLATHSLVSCSINAHNLQRTYGLTPLSNLFIPNQTGVSLCPFLALVEDDVVRSNWTQLKDAVERGGVPFKMAHDGVAAFDYPGIDPRFNNVLNKAMYNYTTLIFTKILQKYKGFNDIKVLVDVGGGIGHTINAIISQYPSIKGINFDLPHVINNAKPYPGVEHVAGNMFESVPKGDVILMKGILHDWSDEYCKKVLKNCYEAVPENGKVIILELILTEEPETTDLAKAITQFDIYLMNIGGKERTEKEIFDLATHAGFKTFNVACQVAQYWVLEFIK